MIRVKIMGGLGNQLFQYAFARSIQINYGFEVEIETSWYENMGDATPRDFLINRLNCKLNFTNPNEKKRCKYVINESTMETNEIIDDAYYVGYWQNPAFFKDIKSQLRSELCFKRTSSEENIFIKKSSADDFNTVSIHVRRGDYLKYTNHPVCEITYYKAAVDYLRSKYREIKFLVFSDDLLWCKHNLTFLDNVQFISTGNDLLDWHLMKMTKHHIIANSTYSWWAAWLGDQLGEVVMPRLWLHKDNHNELRCEGWIVL